jgi:translocation and assembly module TamA
VDADGTARAPVVVRVRERPAHRVAFGAGVSSNTGARVEARYHTPDLFGRDWSFDGGLRYEQKRQTLYADVFLPPDQRDRRHSVGAVLEASDIQGLRTERRAFGAQTVQQRGRVEQRLSLHWEVEDRTPDGGATVTSRALVPNAMWTWRRLDSVLNRGPHRAHGQVRADRAPRCPYQDFVRLHARPALPAARPAGHAALRG